MSDQLFWLCEHGEAKMHYGCGHLTGIKHLCADSLCPGGHPVEGGEGIPRCDPHSADWVSDLPPRQLFVGCWRAFVGAANGANCRMVERFLIPLSNTEKEK